MRASKREKNLTSHVGARLLPAEAERVAKCAAAVGLTNSEWIRQVILQAFDLAIGDRLVLSELLALRKIFLLLQVDSAEGLKLSPERLRNAVEQAEATKFSMAEGRIRSFSLQSKSIEAEGQDHG